MGGNTWALALASPSPSASPLSALSWHAIIVDGHSVEELCKAFGQAKHQPTAIIAKTFKGRGITGKWSARPMGSGGDYMDPRLQRGRTAFWGPLIWPLVCLWEESPGCPDSTPTILSWSAALQALGRRHQAYKMFPGT